MEKSEKIIQKVIDIVRGHTQPFLNWGVPTFLNKVKLYSKSEASSMNL